jgi:hypothetical protein
MTDLLIIRGVPLGVGEMGSSLGFPANLFGSLPRAGDSGDSGTTSL